MSSREHQLLSRIIRTGDLSSALEWGITEQDFMSAEPKALFHQIVSYHQAQHGSVIGQNAALAMFPQWQMCDDQSMHTKALCEEVRKHRLAIQGAKMLGEVQQLLMTDPHQAVNMLSGYAADLTMLASNRITDVRLGDSFDRELTRYDLKKKGWLPSVCPLPWDPWQVETGGLQDDDYIVFYGRPKSMKTWVLAWFIAWCFEHQKRCLIYTKEMAADNIFRRLIGCLARVDYSRLRLGTLTTEEEFSLQATRRMVKLSEQDGNIVTLSGQDANGKDTVPWLQSKVETYKPDVVFVDGMYLMSPTDPRIREDHARVRSISRDLRQMILNTKTPVVSTLQANRNAAKNKQANTDEIAFSDAIGQDATQLFRVIKEKHRPTIAIVSGGATREFNLLGFRIHAQPCENFTYYGEITAKEIEQATESDTGPADDAAAAKPAAKKTGMVPSPVQAVQQQMNGYMQQPVL
jgi:hypothetical protein